jgi:hypothetical protein
MLIRCWRSTDQILDISVFLLLPPFTNILYLYFDLYYIRTLKRSRYTRFRKKLKHIITVNGGAS